MKEHYKNRVWSLRPHRIDDVLYTETLFSSIPSIRCYKCFQIFAYKQSKCDRLILMKREENAPEAYEDVI